MMRAKKIYENINFERGRDPKSAMSLGKASKSGTVTNITRILDGAEEMDLDKEHWHGILSHLNYGAVKDDYIIEFKDLNANDPEFIEAAYYIRDLIGWTGIQRDHPTLEYLYYDGEYYKIPFQYNTDDYK